MLSFSSSADDSPTRRREHDVVLVGATGFTGRLAAEHLARSAAPGTRIAFAGRNMTQLATLARNLAPSGTDAVALTLLHADMDEPSTLRELAEGARVVVSAVGPYLVYGEPLVAACTEAGTDYVDLAGEPAFVDRMWSRYHERALETGARLVHSCGWTAVPHDLGTLLTVEQLPEGAALDIRCLTRLSSTLSGGAYRSMIASLIRPHQVAWAALRRSMGERRAPGRRIRAVNRPPFRAADVRGWRLPYPTIDRQTVLRSARALDRYGPDFRYGLYLVVRRPTPIGALRTLASYREAGQGPTAEERDRGWFEQTFIGRGGGRRVVVEVRGGDPWYTEASKMLAQAALCLACDDLPPTAGQVTPAVAMGHALTERLARVGIEFRVGVDDER